MFHNRRFLGAIRPAFVGAGGSTLKTNLISFWEFESGSLVTDAVVATANDLTNNNVVTSAAVAPTKVGNYSLYVDSLSQSLSHASNASLQVTGSTDFSISAWIYADTLGSGHSIVTKMGGDGTYRLELNGSDQASFTVFSTDGGFSSNTVAATSFGALSTSTWYFVAVTVNKSGNVGISVNDGTVNTTAYSITQSGGDGGTFYIGNNANSGIFWNGRIDQVGFWKKVLSAGEITQLYNSGSGLSYASM